MSLAAVAASLRAAFTLPSVRVAFDQNTTR